MSAKDERADRTSSERWRRWLLALGLLLSVLGFPFSLMGLAMAYWVAALPNQSREHVLFNWLFWIFAAVMSFLLIPFLSYKLRKAAMKDAEGEIDDRITRREQ